MSGWAPHAYGGSERNERENLSIEGQHTWLLVEDIVLSTPSPELDREGQATYIHRYSI